jgi:hypothetical protein
VITPQHETTLPSSGKKVKFRQFLVGEEKILLIALEEGLESSYVDALKVVIQRVMVTELDVDNLPMIDIDHLFLQLRSHSVGSIIELKYTCKNILTKESGEQKQCRGEISVDIPIDKITLQNMGETKTIILHEDIGVVLKYPKFKTLQKIMKLDTNNTEDIFALIAESVDNIFDGNQVYRSFTKEEWDTFLNSLPGGCLDKILAFLTNTPYHHYKTTFKCPKCGNTGELEYQGLKDFFE